MIGSIKSYNSLEQYEKNLFCDFINRNNSDKNSQEDIEKLFNLSIYDYGRGVLLYIIDNKVVAKLCIVLEVAKDLNSSYIHQFEILEGICNINIILSEIVQRAIDVSREYGANDIRLGVSDKHILDKLGLYAHYNSYKMNLENRRIIINTLDLETLSEGNKYEYVKIYNDSFRDMPHGTITNINKVEENITNINDLNYYFFVLDGNKRIGFMEVTINEEEGIFDIGLCKSYRNKGYGKLLLDKAIEFLNQKNVKKVSLIVIEENKIAYNMYLKRGFEVKETLGHWIKLTDGE